MKNYKVNFDFELQLANPKLAPNKKINREFEYVFFFINNKTSSLKNYFPYNEKYLDSLREHGITVPIFVDEEGDNWWGDESLKKSQQLNSKVFSTQLALEDKVLPKTYKIVSSYSEIKKILNTNKKFLLRSDYGFSGKGHFQLNNETNVNAIEKFFAKSGLSVFSPYFSRILDIGVTVDLTSNDYFIVENFNHPTGSFRGGRYFSDSRSLQEQYSFIDLEKLNEAIRWNKASAKAVGAVGFIQIDMFYYQEEHTIKLCAHVEWNYRKTMGLMLKALRNILQKKYVSWIIVPTKSVGAKLDASLYLNLVEGVIITSPIENHYFFSFGVGANSAIEFNDKLVQTLDQLQIVDEFTRTSSIIKI